MKNILSCFLFILALSCAGSLSADSDVPDPSQDEEHCPSPGNGNLVGHSFYYVISDESGFNHQGFIYPRLTKREIASGDITASAYNHLDSTLAYLSRSVEREDSYGNTEVYLMPEQVNTSTRVSISYNGGLDEGYSYTVNHKAINSDDLARLKASTEVGGKIKVVDLEYSGVASFGEKITGHYGDITDRECDDSSDNCRFTIQMVACDILE